MRQSSFQNDLCALQRYLGLISSEATWSSLLQQINKLWIRWRETGVTCCGLVVAWKNKVAKWELCFAGLNMIYDGVCVVDCWSNYDNPAIKLSSTHQLYVRPHVSQHSIIAGFDLLYLITTSTTTTTTTTATTTTATTTITIPSFYYYHRRISFNWVIA